MCLAPLSRIVSKLSRGAAIITEALPVPAPLSRTNSPGSLMRTNSNATVITEQTQLERPSTFSERPLESVGRGSILCADGLLDLTHTEMESVAPHSASRSQYDESDDENQDKITNNMLLD